MRISIAAAAWAAMVPAAALAQTAEPAAESAFTLPPLPYEAGALAPAIDAQTMELHHGRHHQAYVDNLNKAVAANPDLAGQSLEELVAVAGTLPDAVRNNAGGHWNHSFFWETMAPTADAGEPSPELTAAIDESFGSMDEFKAAFEQAGAARFGSGWVWLIRNAEGELAVTSTPNQDNPLMDVAEDAGEPILGNDVWEHAYYITYNNRRPEYLSAWWDVVDWDTVSERFAETAAAQ